MIYLLENYPAIVAILLIWYVINIFTAGDDKHFNQ
jgi:hypothetical protein